MFLLFFLFIASIGLYTAYRLLWPEMYVKLNRPDFNFPWNRPHLRPDAQPSDEVVVDAPYVDLPRPIVDAPRREPLPGATLDKIGKLENLLFEKNKIIDRLQEQLENERLHRKEFENVRTILDEEIKHLREQLRGFRNYYKEKTDA